MLCIEVRFFMGANQVHYMMVIVLLSNLAPDFFSLKSFTLFLYVNFSNRKLAFSQLQVFSLKVISSRESLVFNSGFGKLSS